jgi:prevent-host-death family protein
MVDNVVTRDYIKSMKKIRKALPLYKQRSPALGMTPETTGPQVLREAVSMPGIGLTIPVRAAKAKLSALLELVAGGQEITITSDGRPKAVLLPLHRHKPQKVFTGTWEQLKTMPMQTEGPLADEIIRADRDGRGW